MLTTDGKEFAIDLIKIKHEKLWTYAISLTRNFVYSITPHKIIVHNEPLTCVALAFTIGEGKIIFESVTLGLAALPLLLKTGKEIYSGAKNYLKRASHYIKTTFFDGAAEKNEMRNRIIRPNETPKINAQQKKQNFLEAQQRCQPHTTEMRQLNQQQNIKTNSGIQTMAEGSYIDECCKANTDNNPQNISVNESMQQSLGKFEEAIAPIRKHSEYKYDLHNRYEEYTFDKMRAENLFSDTQNYYLAEYNAQIINFREPHLSQGIEKNSSYFGVDLPSIGQYFINAYNDRRDFEHIRRQAEIEGYRWDEDLQMFVLIYEFSQKASKVSNSQNQQNMGVGNSECCSKTCNCHDRLKELEKKIKKNNGKRVKFDFKNAEDDAITKAPEYSEWTKGLRHRKYKDFLFDELNNVWWTKDINGADAHSGTHWKIYKEIGTHFERICEVVAVGHGYVKVINKNKDKIDSLPRNEFDGMKKQLSEVGWLFEFFKELNKCPCGEVCPCK